MSDLEFGERRARELELTSVQGHHKEPQAPGYTFYYKADDIHRLLGVAHKMNCYLLGESNLTDQHGPGWMAEEPSTRHEWLATHTALLIGIREIKKDTAQSLLRELLDCFIVKESKGPFGEKFTSIVDRAKALLERGEK